MCRCFLDNMLRAPTLMTMCSTMFNGTAWPKGIGIPALETAT